MALDPLARNNVTVVGRQDADQTMVFVNGLGYDQSFWSAVASGFAQRYRLVLFDHVGSVASNQASFSEHQSRYLNVSGYSADLLEILAALKITSGVVLVGHSLGALAGLLASIARPALFDRLVLLGASPRYADAPDYAGGFSKADIDAVYGALQRNYLVFSQRLASAALCEPQESSLAIRFAQTIASIPSEMMLTVLCSVLQTDHRASLSQVSVPTLLVQSQEDYFVPLAVAHYLHAHIPGSQLQLIDVKGHLPHVSAPQRVIEAIEGFVGQAVPVTENR